MQAVRTNVLGTENVLGRRLPPGWKRVVVLSTDKAVPDQRHGHLKAMMER